jgi:hypothetical protein
MLLNLSQIDQIALPVANVDRAEAASTSAVPTSRSPSPSSSSVASPFPRGRI